MTGRDFYFSGAEQAAPKTTAAAPITPAMPTTAPATQVDKSVMELAFWNGIKDSSDATMYEAYLEQYPQGTFAPLARAKVKKLNSKSFRVASLDTRMMVLKSANVRLAPFTQAPKVGTLNTGNTINITGKTKVSGSTWYRVALANGSGGYVFGQLLGKKPAAPQQAALPPPPTPTPPAPTPVVKTPAQQSSLRLGTGALMEPRQGASAPRREPDLGPGLSFMKNSGETAANLIGSLFKAATGTLPDQLTGTSGRTASKKASEYYNKANVLYDKGRYNQAAQYYKLAVRERPFGSGYYNLGLSYAALGKQQRSKQAFRKACELKLVSACGK